MSIHPQPGFNLRLNSIHKRNPRKNNNIKIIDWVGNTLYEGNFKSDSVDKVLDANRCSCEEGCDECDNTGYKGDFHVEWEDQNREDNVYEFINY